MRKLTEDELADYRDQEAEKQYHREQAKKWADNQGKHVSDPDREWGEEE